MLFRTIKFAAARGAFFDQAIWPPGVPPTIKKGGIETIKVHQLRHK
jgi:hypothetical protein